MPESTFENSTAVKMVFCTILQSCSAYLVPVRCQSNAMASVSGRTLSLQPGMHRLPFQSLPAQRRPFLTVASLFPGAPADLQPAAQQQPAMPQLQPRLHPAHLLQASAPLWLLTAAPAIAAESNFSQGSASQASYYATLFLFVSTLPGVAVLPHNFSDGAESLFTQHIQTVQQQAVISASIAVSSM